MLEALSFEEPARFAIAVPPESYHEIKEAYLADGYVLVEESLEHEERHSYFFAEQRTFHIMVFQESADRTNNAAQRVFQGEH